MHVSLLHRGGLIEPLSGLFQELTAYQSGGLYFEMAQYSHWLGAMVKSLNGFNSNVMEQKSTL